MCSPKIPSLILKNIHLQTNRIFPFPTALDSMGAAPLCSELQSDSGCGRMRQKKELSSKFNQSEYRLFFSSTVKNNLCVCVCVAGVLMKSNIKANIYFPKCYFKLVYPRLPGFSVFLLLLQTGVLCLRTS